MFRLKSKYRKVDDNDWEKVHYAEEDYRRFLLHMDNQISDKNDIEYLDYMIKLLRQEVKYAGLLEINRGKAMPSEIHKFQYPFGVFDFSCIGIDPFSAKKQTIDISEDVLASRPWKDDRYKEAVSLLRKDEFKYEPSEHMATYYNYLDIACATNGLHTLGVGSVENKGIIEANMCDTPKLFPFINANGRMLRLEVNKEAVLDYIKKNNIPHTDNIDKLIGTKASNIDYRLLLLYTLSQRKWFLENR